jgi:hypothetical protein
MTVPSEAIARLPVQELEPEPARVAVAVKSVVLAAVTWQRYVVFELETKEGSRKFSLSAGSLTRLVRLSA